ncbi:MAG: UvrD-helicase domain-containing protein [Verrucomicrobia bacterium]|nr:UvrD-helicase domain-containing protein [Verrucomicrobiota bacterium]
MQDMDFLNEAQKKAVTHKDGPLLVLAGAGCGKTGVVTHRIGQLIAKGVAPSEILAVTFTNKAAQEMKERVHKLVQKDVLTTTFHALGARILREAIHEIGYQNSFVIYDEKDSENLIKECLKSLGLPESKEMLKSAKQKISEAKNQLLFPEMIKDPSISEVYTSYQRRLKEYNALDFDDLLFLTVQLLNAPIGDAYQERWTHILVDEYQDTNHAQYNICKLLSGKYRNICVVGDPDQSIYSWRGANRYNLLNFERDFPGALVVKLEENYRSTNQILMAANKLISCNDRVYEKDLWSSLGEGERVRCEIFAKDHFEAHFIMERLQEELRKYSGEEIAILYRTNAQSRILEDALLKNRIPYLIIGGLSFYQRKEIKDLLAFLRLAVARSDMIAFLRTINIPKRGFGLATVDKIRGFADADGLPILDLLEKLIDGDPRMKLSAKQRAELTVYLNIFDEIERMAENKDPIDQIMKRLIIDSRYEDFLKEDKESYEDRKENMEELVAKAYSWQKENNSSDLRLFLEELSLKGSADDPNGKERGIRLMTVHNSKGLEFNVCFLVGMEEELFPHINAQDSPEGIEEERRLCYVGMTRARKKLFLTASLQRFLWGHPRSMKPSRFLTEIFPRKPDNMMPAPLASSYR